MYLDIYEAIEHRRLMQVYYGRTSRVVEPHVYGTDLKGHDVLKVYQIAGADEFGRHVGWKWFTVARMEEVLVLSTRFSPSRSTEGARDRPLRKVYCQVEALPTPADSLIRSSGYQPQ